MKFSVPLEVQVSKAKKFILNLNVYRNAHHMTLSKSKSLYSEIVKGILGETDSKFTKVKIIYTLYPKDRRRKDLSNVCSIVDKYVCDALVEKGILPDDDYTVVTNVEFKFGAVDKENPRVDIEILQIEE